MTISCDIEFKNLALDAIAKTECGDNTLSKFVWKGTIQADKTGLILSGRHKCQYPGAVHFLLWLVIFGIGLIIWGEIVEWSWEGKTWSIVFWVIILLLCSTGISAYLWDYVILKTETISISWDAVTEFAVGKGRNSVENLYPDEKMVGISFASPYGYSPAIFTGKDVETIHDFLKSIIPAKERVVAYEDLVPNDYQQICQTCSAKTNRYSAMCERCGGAIVPSFVLDDDANRHILKIRGMVAEGIVDKEIASNLKKQKEKCLINDGKWTEAIVKQIRTRFSFKGANFGYKNSRSESNEHYNSNEGSSRVLQRCPSCGKHIRIPYPPPSSSGICKGCESRFRVIVDINGSIHLILLEGRRQSNTHEKHKNDNFYSTTDTNGCLAILEVTDAATSQEIRNAYKKKMKEYHPDKVAQLGVELKEVAERKSKEINAAYNHLKNVGRA